MTTDEKRISIAVEWRRVFYDALTYDALFMRMPRLYLYRARVGLARERVS